MVLTGLVQWPREGGDCGSMNITTALPPCANFPQPPLRRGLSRKPGWEGMSGCAIPPEKFYAPRSARDFCPCEMMRRWKARC